MAFYLGKDTPLTRELLSKMIERFHVQEKPRLLRYKNYYDGKQAILNKSYQDATKPCSHAVINYCRNIVDSYCGYMATPGHITYRSNDDIADVMDILRYNDYQTEDSDFLLDALVYGVAAELMYIDNAGKTRFRLINPTSCFGIYDDSLTGDLMYFVRIYKASEWDNSSLYMVDVYSDYGITHYSMTGETGSLIYKDEEPHYFGQCPANIFYLPDEKSVFDCVISLQDAANELLNSEIDDYSAFCDAYLSIEGADLGDEIQTMKENRVLLLPEGAKASWLTKNASDAQVENILKRIHESIYRISQCVDFSLENVGGGVSSGIAIRYRLTGMENHSGTIEGKMKKALQRRIEIICGIASLKLGEEVFRDVEIEFLRNVPTDNAEIVNLINSLKGTVSDKTLLGMIPGISDVEAEMEAIQEQKERNMAIYGLGFQNSNTEDEEEEV